MQWIVLVVVCALFGWFADKVPDWKYVVLCPSLFVATFVLAPNLSGVDSGKKILRLTALLAAPTAIYLFLTQTAGLKTDLFAGVVFGLTVAISLSVACKSEFKLSRCIYFILLTGPMFAHQVLQLALSMRTSL